MVLRKTRTKNSEENAAALHNAQTPHAARVAFAQTIYCDIPLGFTELCSRADTYFIIILSKKCPPTCSI
jgi:hypothetical protein